MKNYKFVQNLFKRYSKEAINDDIELEDNVESSDLIKIDVNQIRKSKSSFEEEISNIIENTINKDEHSIDSLLQRVFFLELQLENLTRENESLKRLLINNGIKLK